MNSIDLTMGSEPLTIYKHNITPQERVILEEMGVEFSSLRTCDSGTMQILDITIKFFT